MVAAFCCCCCQDDCGDQWLDYSNPAYSVYFRTGSGNFGDSNGFIQLAPRMFSRQFFESPLTPVYLDGYEFVPNSYVSPLYSDYDCGGVNFTPVLNIRDDYSTDDSYIIARYNAIGAATTSHLNAILEGFF